MVIWAIFIKGKDRQWKSFLWTPLLWLLQYQSYLSLTLHLILPSGDTKVIHIIKQLLFLIGSFEFSWDTASAVWVALAVNTVCGTNLGVKETNLFPSNDHSVTVPTPCKLGIKPEYYTEWNTTLKAEYTKVSLYTSSFYKEEVYKRVMLDCSES